MNRKMTVAQPVMYPACCLNCGAVQNSGRWFVDLGFDIDERFDAMPDGVVYLCSECVKNFITQLMEIVEEKEMGLDYVAFGGTKSYPVFDEHREVLNRSESKTDGNDSDTSEPEHHEHPFNFAPARFGGLSN